MNEIKKRKRQEARWALTQAAITFQSLNNDLHWKVGSINFFPTTGLWKDELSGIEGQGFKSLIKNIKKEVPGTRLPACAGKGPRSLNVDQIFEVAKKVIPCNLYEVCKAIHKEIYGGTGS